MAKRKKAKVDPFEGKVFVPKIGYENEFKSRLEQMVKIANGPLGWQGHAEMFVTLGLVKEGSDVKEAEALIKQVFMSAFMEVAELVTEEQAEKREKSTKVLYGNGNSSEV